MLAKGLGGGGMGVEAKGEGGAKSVGGDHLC